MHRPVEAVVRLCAQIPIELSDRLTAETRRTGATKIGIIRLALDSWLPAAAPKS